MDLLRADRSTLSADQWNLLSNLSHCYDDHAGLSLGEHYMFGQNNLPPKFRFKSASILELFQAILDAAQPWYKNNRDFLSISTDDRSIILHGTLSHSASVSANFILHKIQLLGHPAFYNAVKIIGPADLVTVASRLSQLLDFDMIIMKLFLAILSFSTFRYTVYPHTSSSNLSNIREILRIQDQYIELTWRYLLYKCDPEQAVKCFSDFIRCVFIVNEGIVEVQRVRWFTDMIDTVTEKAKQSLSLND